MTVAHCPGARVSRRAPYHVAVIVVAMGVAACARGGGGRLPYSYSLAVGDDAIASDVVLARADVPSDWVEVFDPPSDSNMDHTTRRCLDGAGARTSGHFASANYVRGEALIYSYADVFTTEDAAAAAFRVLTGDPMLDCLKAWTDAMSIELQAFDRVGQQSIVLHFVYPDPRYRYFDVAALQQGRAVVFLLYRNRAGPFPVELRDQLARAMVARAATTATPSQRD
jgi:hypothetical protein